MRRGRIAKAERRRMGYIHTTIIVPAVNEFALNFERNFFLPPHVGEHPAAVAFERRIRSFQDLGSPDPVRDAIVSMAVKTECHAGTLFGVLRYNETPEQWKARKERQANEPSTEASRSESKRLAGNTNSPTMPKK